MATDRGGGPLAGLGKHYTITLFQEPGQHQSAGTRDPHHVPSSFNINNDSRSSKSCGKVAGSYITSLKSSIFSTRVTTRI